MLMLCRSKLDLLQCHGADKLLKHTEGTLPASAGMSSHAAALQRPSEGPASSVLPRRERWEPESLSLSGSVQGSQGRRSGEPSLFRVHVV